MKWECDYCGCERRHVTEHEGFILCPTCLGVLPFVLPRLRLVRLLARLFWWTALTIIVIGVVVICHQLKEFFS